MVLAAGLGTRMAPLTAHRAKASLPVLDVPLVARAVAELARGGVELAVVNAHAHGDQLREALAKAPIPVELCYEPELRGTGGGLVGAREWLDGSDAFLVVNADMVADVDVAALLAAHARQGALATLALRRDSRSDEFGSIGYASTGLVCRITERCRIGDELGSGLFTGVHAIQPELLDLLPERGAFDIVADAYVGLLEGGARLGTWLQPPDAAWWPVGTPRELLDANLRALEREARRSGAADAVLAAPDALVEGDVVGPAWLGSSARVPASARVGPRAVVGRGARVPPGARVSDSLLLPGARPPGSEPLQRAVAFDEEIWRDG